MLLECKKATANLKQNGSVAYLNGSDHRLDRVLLLSARLYV